ncbi:hypothetical protein JVT61DRAFT_14766 [Boletus reticuloceps]|uniref:Transmembrane protein n=1 Tax=Boletus reticuloceps TaxID=495285 RepID=A0A8I2YTQ3_9AGAM|nr:hypothetical protein JVT61DRAFT_14766 [Boletus reticuloceps]
MPDIPSDVAFTHPAVHRWHARQNSPAPASSIIIIVVVSIIICVVLVGSRFVRNAVRAANSTHVPPPRVVQAPPGAQRGPIINEILAGGVAGAVVRQEQESMSPVPAYSHDPPSTDNQPSQATTPDDNNRRSRTPLDAGVTRADAPPRTITIHRDAGPASQDDEDPPDELPPPYSSIGSP